jgi:hypothetical protein
MLPAGIIHGLSLLGNHQAYLAFLVWQGFQYTFKAVYPDHAAIWRKLRNGSFSFNWIWWMRSAHPPDPAHCAGPTRSWASAIWIPPSQPPWKSTSSGRPGRYYGKDCSSTSRMKSWSPRCAVHGAPFTAGFRSTKIFISATRRACDGGRREGGGSC